MNEQRPRKRWFDFVGPQSVPKHAVTIGIIIGGILGTTLGLVVLRIIRPAVEEEYDPALLEPIRVLPPRPKPSPDAVPSTSSIPPTISSSSKGANPR